MPCTSLAKCAIAWWGLLFLGATGCASAGAIDDGATVIPDSLRDVTPRRVIGVPPAPSVPVSFRMRESLGDDLARLKSNRAVAKIICEYHYGRASLGEVWRQLELGVR